MASQAYEAYRSVHATERWRALERRGARPQRLLWACASTPDSGYGEVKYVEELIAADTVCTLPLETLAAYRDHGRGGPGLDALRAEAPRVLRELAALGIDLARAAEHLEGEGVRGLSEAFEQLQRGLEERRRP